MLAGVADGRLAVGIVQVFEPLLDVLATEVRRHDDDRILEIHRPALVVGEPSVVKNLQKRIEYVGVCLLNLVEQHHAVGLAAYGFGKLSALVVAHIPRRRSDKTRYTELLLILAHVDSRHHVFVVKQIFGQRLGQFGLACARGSEEDKRCNGALGVLKSGTAAAYGVAYGLDGLVLSYDALVQFLFKMQQLVAFALQHPRYGYARPAAYYLGNIVGSDLLAHHSGAALRRFQLQLYAVDVALQLLELTVSNLGHATIVAFPLGLVGLKLQAFYILFILLYFVNEVAFSLPLGAELAFLLLQFGYLLVE